MAPVSKFTQKSQWSLQNVEKKMKVVKQVRELRACLKSSNKNGNEGKSKKLSRNKEFALAWSKILCKRKSRKSRSGAMESAQAGAESLGQLGLV